MLSGASPRPIAVAPPLSPGDVHLSAVSLAVEPADVQRLATCLSVEERARAARFIFDRDRRRFLVARATLSSLLAAHLEIEPGSVRFEVAAHGKPSLAQAHASDVRFNVSHSGELAVFGFTRGREIGVDVEALRALDDAEAIARRFFAEVESRALMSASPADRPAAFFNGWTRKEAYIKAIGDGLSCPLHAFAVTLRGGEPVRFLRIGEDPAEPARWTLHAWRPSAGYVAAMAVRARGLRIFWRGRVEVGGGGR
jgi:4'-phosphopantetheinyl transferase